MSDDLVDESYTDAHGRRRRISDEVRSAVVAAMGDGRADRPRRAVAIAPPGSALLAAGAVTLEDGTELGRVEQLPRDLPYGYHHLVTDDGVDHLLVSGPGRCHLPNDLRAWGWAIQLSTTRSRASWGIGDLADLRSLGTWSRDLGAGFVAVSPLGAPNPGPSPEPSPYYPSTRRFGNPLHLRIEEVPGVADVADLAAAGTALNGTRRVDRVRALQLKRAALERSWEAAAFDREAFERWRAERGIALQRWACFVVLSERFGPGWHAWPEEYRDPDGAAVARLATEQADAVAFHAWVQWCFDLQLEAASAPLRRIADMPVGVDPGGFDAWDWQDQLAEGATVGAPPDRFNAAGQDWGLPPFTPHRLRDAHYRPFIDTIRAQLRHAGGLRIDHVLGLFRLWWIPAGGGPDRGAYVRYPTDELLEIVALESHRSRAVVIGEDLGTVPPGVRSELRRRNLLSTRLALFEKRPPDRYPVQAFAGVTTHDLPTIAGAWSGSDLDDQARAGIEPNADGLEQLRRRLASAAAVDATVSWRELSYQLHRRIAASPSVLVAATLEDALGVTERPNMPGTTAPARDNWSLALPAPLEDMWEDRGVADLAEVLSQR